MSKPLYVAAGGGGDALAALMASRALGDTARPTVVASYSWDRYLIDPAPGPRSPTDFANLQRLTEHCSEVTNRSHLHAGGTSGLTLLAQHTPARFVLLDPSGGAVGLRRQLTELVEYHSADCVTLVDVGGDVTARGEEPTLLSPLADSLALAALVDLPVPTNVAILGPGLDGELPQDDTHEQLRAVGATPLQLVPDHVEPYLPALEHHPSEATTLVAAAALGLTGTAEIRDKGALVPLTKDGAAMYVAPSHVILSWNTVAQKLITTRSFTEAEAATAAICGRTELDHERRKAQAGIEQDLPEPSPDELRSRFHAYRDAAVERGVSLVSFRRLTEVVGKRRYDPPAIRALVGDLAHERLPLCRITSA